MGLTAMSTMNIERAEGLLDKVFRATTWLAVALFILAIGTQLGIYEGRKMERKKIETEQGMLAGFSQRDMAVEAVAELRDTLERTDLGDDETLLRVGRLVERTATAIRVYERGRNGR